MAGATTDGPAIAAVRTMLTAAGVHRITTVSPDAVPSGSPLTVYVGGPADNSASAGALQELGVAGPAGLAAEGYVLATGSARGRGVVVLSGVDGAGTFYAAQTLRQLVQPGRPATIPAVESRDWPGTALRGVIEGFYGAPWSDADRESQFDFYGRTKQNIYVYSPKDDPYLREQWRDPYPADKLAALRQLVARATANHVAFTYALSPGLSICYSSATDLQLLVAKFQSLYDAGVRSFAVPLDDISYTSWNCAADETKFGTGGGAAGAAQAYLLNQVQSTFIAGHPDLEPLQMVPTEYYNVTESPYKKAIREQLDPAVVVEWTGTAVVPATITTAQTVAAKAVFGHPILIWDNYPVNDYTTARLLLGPYVGREPGVATTAYGITANPMVQAEASKIAEFTSGDYLWNPTGYDPDASWLAALDEVGGPVAPALKVLAENSYSSIIQPVESPVLAPLISAFQAAITGNGDPVATGHALSAYLDQMAAAPGTLRAGLGNPALLDEVGPWLDELGDYGVAGRHAVAMLLAQHAGDATTAWQEHLATQQAMTAAAAVRVETAGGPVQPSISPGVFAPFVQAALTSNANWFGVTAPVTAITSLGTYQDYVPSRMVDGDPATFFWSDAAAATGSYVGVDLGESEGLQSIDITMSTANSPSDYIHAGVVEVSADGEHWTAVGAPTTTPTVHVDLPAGVSARYVRLRTTADQTFWVTVDEFTVTASGGHTLTAAGSPAPIAGSTLRDAVDGRLDTAYAAATAPVAGDALTVTLGAPAAVEQVTVLQDPDRPAAGTVEVRRDGGWTPVGALDGAVTTLPVGGDPVGAVRVSWVAGTAPPKVYEVVPEYVG